MDDNNYYLKCFEILTSQRMKSFDFYILINALLLAGIATILARGDLTIIKTVTSLIISFGIVYFAAVFEDLDKRTSAMIKINIKYLIKSEKREWPKMQKTLFSESKEEYNNTESSKTYGGCFRRCFKFFCIVGIILSIINTSIMLYLLWEWLCLY